TVDAGATSTGSARPASVEQVVAGGWSRLVVSLDVEGEGDEAFALVEQVRATAEAQYGDAYRLAGAEVSVYDLHDTVQQDAGRVKLFSMLSIGLVLAL
ncbi:hypothetical protein, partial [Eggerthella lenta]|uniref:hypothetical protein n=1 Tax=Eggerthella lenta TaxID=84112 RepID=UPI00210BBC78